MQHTWISLSPSYYLSFYLSIPPSIHPSLAPLIYLSIPTNYCSSQDLFIHVTIYLSTHPCFSLSLRPSLIYFLIHFICKRLIDWMPRYIYLSIFTIQAYVSLFTFPIPFSPFSSRQNLALLRESSAPHSSFFCFHVSTSASLAPSECRSMFHSDPKCKLSARHRMWIFLDSIWKNEITLSFSPSHFLCSR